MTSRFVLTRHLSYCHNVTKATKIQSPGQVNSFGFPASPTNFIQPGKRPQSSIASSIAENLETGEITIATGSAGGSRIITATLQELYHYIGMMLTILLCFERFNDLN